MFSERQRVRQNIHRLRDALAFEPVRGVLAHGIAENRRGQADAGLVGSALLDLGHRFGLAVDAAEELVRPRLAGLAQAPRARRAPRYRRPARRRRSDLPSSTVRIVAAPPSLLTVSGDMSATMVTPGMSFSESRIATNRGARNCRLSWVSSTTLRLAAEPVADVGGRRIAQHLAGQILRRVEERGRGRRHDGADIGAGPDHLLQAAAERRRIDRRGDHRADFRGEKDPAPARSSLPDRCRRARPDIRARDPWPPSPARARRLA